MRSNTRNLVYWGVMAALGVFIIVAHRAALTLVCRVLAIGLVIAACGGLARWWRDREAGLSDPGQLAGSLALLGIGLWILLKTGSFLTLINVIIGGVIALYGLVSLVRATRLGGGLLTKILPAAGVVLGILIASNNWATTWFTVLEGLGLLYTAVTGFITDYELLSLNRPD